MRRPVTVEGRSMFSRLRNRAGLPVLPAAVCNRFVHAWGSDLARLSTCLSEDCIDFYSLYASCLYVSLKSQDPGRTVPACRL